uniref:TTF-type domain-containing protein n=1 Tax=Lactuca sativa TaxID=4236 RepID=A0A9R1XQQ3_LACSA|nr:hypothetical protein LSAT_V11C200095890 [Lactuca sativa]
MKTIDSFFKRKNDDEETHNKNQESKPHKASTKILAKQKQMWEYAISLREQVRRDYMTLGPFKIRLQEYHAKEYSLTNHASECFICYIFNDKPSVCCGYNAFTIKGFNNWKKVNDVRK